MNDTNSLSHTKWNCKYHIVFAPKYRRKVFYGERRKEIGEILRTLCNWKKIRIIGKWRYALAEEDGNIRCGFRLIKISQTYKDLVEMLLEFSENSER